MKGVVFTEFFEFVEGSFSPLFLQEIINSANLKSEGVYTATGTYPFCEMGALITEAATKSQLDISHLLKAFGTHLFSYFSASSPQHFTSVDNCFDFLTFVESHIHVDVRKLYPDAELPTFKCIEHRKDKYVMIYSSSRGLGDLCEGLIEGCLNYFGETATIESRLLGSDPITEIEFTLIKTS